MELRHKQEEGACDPETVCDYCSAWREIVLYQWILGVETVIIFVLTTVWIFG